MMSMNFKIWSIMDDRFTPEGISMGSLPFPVLNSKKIWNENTAGNRFE